MDVLALPPEVTSALIHTGPGAGSLMEASAAWQRLGVELEGLVGSYASVLSSLTETWTGPSASAMMQAVQPYLAWLRDLGQQAQQTAASAAAAAAAFSTVRSTVVTPAQVAANRRLLAQLLATNFLGRNLGAIATTEAQYQEMWAMNSAAMGRYQVASTQAAKLTQPSSPPAIADPSGVANQASVVPTATASSAASTAAAAGAAPLAAAPVAADPINLGFADPTTGYFGLANQWGNQFVSSGFPINLLSYLAQTQSAQALQAVSGDVGSGLAEGEAALGPGTGLFGDLGAVGLRSAQLGGTPTAAIGVGVSLGKLTAPPAVVGILPTSQAPVQLASAASPLPADAGMPMIPPIMPPPISPGSGWRKRKQQKYEDVALGAEVKGKVMPRSPSAG
jgi:PPE-repeat protein